MTKHQQSKTTDMSANLLSLPGELRNAIFKQLLTDREPVNPWHHSYPPRPLTPELLRVNKAIHHEASSLLYSQNCFDLTTCDSERLVSFLNPIGRNNASRIQHIYIDFPYIRNLGTDNITFEEDCVRILAKIQSDCSNLRTITTSPGSTNTMALELDVLDNPPIVVKALALVDSHFRAMTSLQEIIVEVYEDCPSAALRREFESHGWTTKVTEQTEESEYTGSCYNVEDDDHRHSDDIFEDDYDIDNDSDFWRRAAD